MTLRRLSDSATKAFAEREEVFPGIQLAQGTIDGTKQYCVVVSDLVAVFFDSNLKQELRDFLRRTWPPTKTPGAPPADIVNRYQAWLGELKEISVSAVSTNRFEFFQALNYRPGLPYSPGSPPAPGARPPAGSPPAVYGHLPFYTVTAPHDVFYKFEAWPTSRRILPKSKRITRGTYASPFSELPFLPTGFSAVARNALPSLFPACFRWEIQPHSTKIYCGAIVPMYGQAGGGVEVMFPKGAMNRGEIANPVVVAPF